MRNRFWDEKRGQMLLWVALAMPILILFAALAVDMGVIYMTRAKLANATDAAVLTGIKTLPYWTTKTGSQSAGQADAQRYAGEMFAGNFGSGSPTQVYTWCPGDPSCAPNTTSLKLHATATVNTTFMAYLPQWAQWSLGAVSQATRGNLVMSIVLDRSGSMADPPTGDGGMTALQNAVPAFVQDFSPGVDHIALLSFGDNSRIDVAMTTQFVNPIKTAVANMQANGATFGTGAGTNTGWSTSYGPPLSVADYENGLVTFPAGTSVEKVVVYFTDGLMNTIQDTFNCPGQVLLNYGGHDASQGTMAVASLDPQSDTNIYGCYVSPLYPNDPDYPFCSHTGLPYAGGTCSNGGTFPSQKYGTQMPLTRANVTEETQYRAIYTANQMRGESPIPTYIFTIGLGQEINDGCTEAFLATLANDPDGSQYNCPAAPAVYNAALPPGLFLPVINCPSPTCTESLNQAFQAIATKILLRLSQ